MRILHTSDWHLGRMLEQINRMDEQRAFIDELCNIAEREDIDLILIAGDIYDTYNPSAAAEELFYEAVDRLNAKGRRAVIVIAGNHDNPERLCAASPLAYKNGIVLLGYPASDAGAYGMPGSPIRMEDSGPGWLEISIAGCGHSAVIITLPYPSEARLEEVLSEDGDEAVLQKAYSEKIGSIFGNLSEKYREDTVNLAVSHLFMLGGETSDSERTIQVGGALTVAPEVLPEEAHYVALGHLHRPQEVKGAPCPAYYSGSPLAYSFSEAGYSKAVFIIDAIPGKRAEIKEEYLNSGKPLKKWVAKKGIEEALAWCEAGRDANGWIDLEIHTDRSLGLEEQKRLRELNPGIINIRPLIKSEIQAVHEAQDRENKKIDELFREFYKHRTGAEIPGDLMETFLEAVNQQEEETDEDLSGGGEAVETEVS